MLGIARASIHRILHSEQLRISPDRTNVLLIDLVIAGSQTTIADQDGASQFLIQHHPHLGLHPGNNVEVSDVNLVITIYLLLLIDGGRRGGAFQQREDLFLLQLALDIALRTSLIFGNVRKDGLNARERGAMDLAHDLRNPGLITLDKDGLISHLASIREQIADVGYTIIAIGMLDNILQGLSIITIGFAVLQNSLLQRTQTLGVLQDLLHIVVTQSGSRGILRIKDIVLHIGIILLIIIVVFNATALFFKSFADNIGNGGLLLFIQGIENILHGLFITFWLLFFLLVLVLQIFVFHFGVLLLFLISMNESNTVSCENICIIEIVIAIITMSKIQLFDICLRVRSGQNKAHFLDIAVRDNICKLVSS